MSISVNAIQESEWHHAEERTRNAVVQVWSQGTLFNWTHPYRSPEQFQGAGSGFFSDTDGRFITNYHVIAGAKSVYVTLPSIGRRPLEASIIGVCPELDVALLMLTKESKEVIEEVCGSINALEFGDSDKLYETQPVLALGYPLGFRTRKSTVGCVAGRDFIQGKSLIHLNAPINPGNSGGPLVDHEGYVVGINTGNWANSQNYNYIVPISEVLVFLPQLYKNRLVRRPDLGVGANRATAAHAQSLKNPLPAGLYINYVFEDSLEQKAGLKVGDMLYEVELNGKRHMISEFGEVSVPWRVDQKISVEELLGRCKQGDTFTYIVYRNGKNLALKGVIEKNTLKAIRTIYPEFEPEELDYEMFAGMIVMQLRNNHFDSILQNPHLADLKEINEYRRPENHLKRALVITAVLPGSLAQLSECFIPGCILSTVNGKEVTTLAQLRKTLKRSLKTGEIAFTLKDRPSTVLSLDEVLAKEPQLSKDFMYPITPSIKSLMKEAKKSVHKSS